MKAHVADWQTRVYCVRIEPANDAPVVRLAGYPVDLVMSNGEVYLTEQGYEFSGLGATSTFASSSVDLKGILQQGAIYRDDLQAGVYDNARVKLFATSWANPIEDEEELGECFFGKAETIDDQYTVQLMGKIDVLSQSAGDSYSPTCQNVYMDRLLGAAGKLPIHRSRCTGPRSAPDGPDYDTKKVTGTLTSVTDQYYFVDSSRAEAADYFATGSIRFLTGPNAGLKPIQVKAFATGGAILLQEALFYLSQVGDQYEMIPGCRKRFDEDCVAGNGNGKNFKGHPHVPAPSQSGQIGRGA
ncbi:DUF2163 domain-containing protein [Pseudomonas sp. JS3066]|uniref:DUF2163 domain-containing protein n=1 Tax=Pseudomonas sp. JS3066 TaxID=3090665 RepID=UPI002E7ADDE4|nr:DUF2163 domain-containing protein [Pseudomonas sp. JS3066]WVK96241.1 DUF2163 domain-containing protein [Pseudomonas sp. JS3066]